MKILLAKFRVKENPALRPPLIKGLQMLAKFFDTNRDGWKKNERKFHMKGVCSAEECARHRGAMDFLSS